MDGSYGVFKVEILTPPEWDFTATRDFKDYAKDKPPEWNIFSYWIMVDERQKATRLEF